MTYKTHNIVAFNNLADLLKPMMRLARLTSILVIYFAFANQGLYAQKDITYINDAYYISSGTTQWYGSVVLGPAARVYITDGDKILFYGDTLKVYPGAQIYGSDQAWNTQLLGRGTGTVVFKQPNPNTGSTVQQVLDGGVQTNSVSGDDNTLTSIEIDNPQGLKLTNFNSRIGTEINFVKGHIFLTDKYLMLTKDAKLNNYNAQKYVVTASSGHLLKENFNSNFEFPVGAGVNDYTPARITPELINSVYVNVNTYAYSAANENELTGIDRTWHIYATAPTKALLQLQHNNNTNMSGFKPEANYITRYGQAPNTTGDNESTGAWQRNNPAASVAGTTPSSEVQTRTFILATDVNALEAFFTKNTDVITGFPDIVKHVTEPVLNADGVYLLKYTLTVINDTQEKITALQIEDDLTAVFGSTGCTYTVNSVVASGTLVGNSMYNGAAYTFALGDGQWLSPGARDSVEITLAVDTHGNDQSISVLNTAKLSCMITNIAFSKESNTVETVFNPINFVVPEALTPNGDGINDKFVIAHGTNLKVGIQVFNRWGGVVFADDNYQNSWEGKADGALFGGELPNGTYYCVYKATDITTGKTVVSGVKFITLKRD